MYFLKPILVGVSFYIQKDRECSAWASTKPNDWSRDPLTGSFDGPKLTEKQLISIRAHSKALDGAQKNHKTIESDAFCGFYGFKTGGIRNDVIGGFSKIRQSFEGLHIFLTKFGRTECPT